MTKIKSKITFILFIALINYTSAMEQSVYKQISSTPVESLIKHENKIITAEKEKDNTINIALYETNKKVDQIGSCGKREYTSLASYNNTIAIVTNDVNLGSEENCKDQIALIDINTQKSIESGISNQVIYSLNTQDKTIIAGNRNAIQWWDPRNFTKAQHTMYAPQDYSIYHILTISPDTALVVMQRTKGNVPDHQLTLMDIRKPKPNLNQNISHSLCKLNFSNYLHYFKYMGNNTLVFSDALDETKTIYLTYLNDKNNSYQTEYYQSTSSDTKGCELIDNSTIILIYNQKYKMDAFGENQSYVNFDIINRKNLMSKKINLPQTNNNVIENGLTVIDESIACFATDQGLGIIDLKPVINNNSLIKDKVGHIEFY